MRSALLLVVVVLLVCRSWDYVKGTGCPPGVPCWSWYPNSQPGHMPHHQPFGHPLVVQNWPPLTAASAQHSQPAIAQQWMSPQQATLGTPTRLYYDKGTASAPAYQTQPNRPLSGDRGIYPESYQSAVGSLAYKNFNPTRESAILLGHSVNPSSTQVFPPGRKAHAPPAPPTQSPIANYLCEIVKRDRNQGMHSTPSPAPQQSSSSHHAIKTPLRRPVQAPPSPRFTTTRPPALPPHPSTSPRPATPPHNRTADGISPSVAACEQYRKAAVSFLDNQVRINGGELVGKGEFPYMVAIGYVRGEALLWACGGSLLSERYVLTAAHCTQSSRCIPDPRAAMALRVGQRRLGARPSAGDLGAEAVRPHPAYRSPEMYHDVALVRTDRAVRFSAAVRPVCLPAPAHAHAHAHAPAPGARWTTAGWGGDGALAQSAFKGDLKKAEMIELAEADCPIEGRSRVPKGLGNRILCTQHRRNNACDGDSGGPLVQQDENGQDVLMGVFSSSPSPCSGNKTALFVRVSSELKWIEKIVWPK